MSRDAKLNDLIRLKHTPAPPVERWQMMPTKHNPGMIGSPLRCATNTHTAKTPESSRLVVKYKKTPKIKSPTCYKTPNQKIPTSSASSTTMTLSKKKSFKSPDAKKKTPSRTGHTPAGCRFIPNRGTTDMEYSSFLVRQGLKDGGDSGKDETSPGTEAYRESLLQAMSQGKRRQKGVLSFRSTPSQKGNASYSSSLSSSALHSSHRRSMKKPAKRLITSAEKILDAPNIEDDYYLNTLDWSKNNLVAIGLGSEVFLWNAVSGSVEQLMEMPGNGSYISSLSWAANGKYLAIGGSNAAVHLWDVEKGKRLRVMNGHSDRVGVLAWNRHSLASGCRDGSIHHHDVRKPEHIVAMSKYHHLEVCGLEWSKDGSRLASGGNDNLVCIWNAGDPGEPSKVLKGHQAAVKAVSWCPWQSNTLATGGGSSDQTIKFWNAFTGECVNSINTKSQVSALAWNKYHRQLISAHGGPKHQMNVWNFPSLTKTGELHGHEGRILHMCLSPKRSSVASAAADETLRVWKAFDEPDLEASQRTYSEDSISALLQSFNH